MLPLKTEVRSSRRAIPAALLLFFISWLTPRIELLGADPFARIAGFCATCGFSGVESVASESGQFVVHSAAVSIRPRIETNSPTIIILEPELVVVTAERAKRALRQELRITDQFRDKIHLSVLDRAPFGQPVAVVSQIHSDGFLYKVGFPAQIEGMQFAKGLVQVLLLEYANRGVRRCAELPAWLIEGMTRQTITAVQPAYVMNRNPVTIERSGYDRLAITRAFLQTNSPLSIQELSFPKVDMTEEERSRFVASSHLLVHRLLELPDGPALMARFLQMLPRTMNWQTALFTVFKSHFDGPLALEKWWMLNWLEFRKLPESWPVPVTLSRLDALLSCPVEIRTGTNSIPSQRHATLQELILSADLAAQREVIGQKVQQLFFASVNVPAELLPLWSGYQRELDSYLQKRANLNHQPTLKSDPEQRAQTLVRATLKALDELDFARSEVKAGRPLVLSSNVQPNR